ncbi:hypothetical protein J437_LFUL009746 [Ladona fulva]|uniref:Uncharacterized protein n=1 Tax=Ladona fulva TaxID=123851 RepID=A0A8K0K5V7_LADFU|nr:hypothetical protein J437_LFUL009746 [Ladona fulva]
MEAAFLQEEMHGGEKQEEWGVQSCQPYKCLCESCRAAVSCNKLKEPCMQSTTSTPPSLSSSYSASPFQTLSSYHAVC